MARLLRGLLALCLVAWGGLAPAQAAEEAIFGPKTYQHPSALPTFEHDAFALPAGIAGPFKLKVWNGESNGHDRVESAWVFLNGVQVAGPHDFDRKIYAFERTVQVKPSNHLIVIIAGRSDTRIRISITGQRILAVPTALSPNPLSVTAGAAGTLTATLAPAPSAAGTLAVASANPGVATAPASVPFAAGQTSVQIPVTAHAAGTTTINASLNGGSASATVNVTPALPTLTSLAPPMLTVTQGANGTLSVTISAAQTSSTDVLLSSGNSSIVSVPSFVAVPAGQVSAQFQASGVSAGSTQVTASLNGSSASSQVTVTPGLPTAVSLLPAVSTVTLGASSTLTLTISAAQTADTTVPVAASPEGILTVPASVVVPAGQTTVAVPVTSVAYGQAGVTASLNGSSASAVVNVVPPPLSLAAIEPATFTMTVGATSTFTVRINAAQIANTEIALESSNPAVLQVPPAVIVAQGQTSATFTATALATGDATITASANSTQRTAAVHVSPQPAAIVSLLPSPLPLQQGATGALTVTINVAQEADITIFLASSFPAIASVPDSVVVPAGTISAQVPVTAVSPGTSQVTASVNGSSAAAQVDVTPPPPVVSAVTPATLSLPKGTPGVLRVTVTRAPNVVTAVELASSDATVASVPPQVNIPAGALFADFPVAANAVGQASITASLNGGTAASTVTVAPAELVALTLSPQTPTAYTGETVPFTVTGTMTDGTTEDFTNRVTWTSSDGAVAAINVSGVASATAAGQTTIGAAFTFSSVLGGQPVTVSTSTVLTVKQPVSLMLTAPVTTLTVGESTTVTVTSVDPAPVGGLLVNLIGSGVGLGTYPAAVTIPEGGMSVSFLFTAAGAGQLTITATAQNRLPGVIAFTIEPPLAIGALSPTSGEVGTLVTLTGTAFNPVPANNLVVFRAINNGTAPAPVISATPTQLTFKVPPLAETGPITLTNSRGSVQSAPFTVVRDQDFQLVLSPASISVYQGAQTAIQAQLSSTGAKAFTGLVTLSVQGLPSNVTPTFSPQTLSAFQTGSVTLGALGAAVTGTYPLTVTAEMKEGGQAFTRSAAVTLNVLPSAGVTGVKGRFVTPSGAGIPGVIVRADTGANPQPQTVTDPAGNFQLGGLTAGELTLRFDATPAHPLYPIWPQTVTLTANKVHVMEDWVISPPPPDERFTPIQPNSPVNQVVGDARFPGLKITIPAGVNIVGWDGVPKSRIAVERLDPDKLPVASPPIKTKSVYQLYFGTPMGGRTVPMTPIPITLPNDLNLEPGTRTALWYYQGSPEEASGKWLQGGMGTVSADGSVIISDPGSGIPGFCGVCGLPCFEAAQNEAPNPPCPDCDGTKQQYGKPVNLATGQELDSAVDLVVDGEVPIVIRRQFNPFDAFAYVANFQQSLGINWTFGGYDVALLPFAGDFSVRLVLPGNSRVDFKRGDDGRFRSGAYSTFDGAELIKVGGTNPSAVGFLIGGTETPRGEPFAPFCTVDGAFYLMRFKDGREWRFDVAPRATGVKIRGGCLFFLTEMRDAQGRFLKIERSDGKITRIHTSSGQFVTFAYSSGVVSGVTDNLGRTVTYNHELVPTKGGFRAFGAASDGNSTQAVFEAAALALGLTPIPPRRVTSVTTPEGTYSYTYEDDPPTLRLGGLSFDSGSSGGISLEPPSCQNVRGGTRLKTIRLPGIDGVFTNHYGPSKRVLRQTWPDGTEIRFNYKVVGGCVPGLRSSIAQPTEGTLISGGSNTSTCQGAGCIRTDSWDGDAVTGGTVVGVEVTDSRGKKFAQDFNSTGMALKATDENGQAVLIERDPNNRVTKMTDAIGRVTQYQYDARGNRTRIVDPAGRETNIAYDAKWNKPTLISRRLDASTVIEYRYSYDPDKGVLLTSTDPENNVTTYVYDSANRLGQIVDPLQHTTNIAYDGQGNPRRITDALGNAVEMVSDTAGRIVQTTDALGNDTRAAYNNLNQLTRITDATQGETRFNFDSRNNLQSVVNPLNHTIESYGYDTIGRLASKTDAHTRSETYQYDGNGNLSSITDRRLQTTSITYDNANRPLRVTYHDGTVQERTYDAAGRLAEIREPDNAQRMEYDTLNRVVRVVTDSLAGLTSIVYEYDALDRRTKRTVAYPGGVLEETAYAYDKASRLLSITQSGVNGTQTTAYAWDAASRLTQKTLPNGIRQQMAYDDANRLLSITYRKTDDSVLEEVSYGYDANGQRTVKTSGAQNVQETLFTALYDNANRMTAITLTGSGKTYNLTYDDSGNLIRKENAADPSEQTLYIWDARNRLATIAHQEAGATATAAFKYDALSRRMERTISQGATFQRVQYVYDGLQAIGEFADGRLAATILSGLNIDEVIARTVNVSGGQNSIATKTYLTDALRSVLVMVNQSQNPETLYAYSAYGETSQLGGDADFPTNSNQYTARENDGLIGGTNGGSLYYYRARYYDPVLKRFIAEDPVGLKGGVNSYEYVRGDPASYTDPDGRVWNFVAGFAIGAIGDIAIQLIANGGRLECIKWDVVLIAGAAGAVNPYSLVSSAGKALKAERAWARSQNLRAGSRAAKRAEQRGDKWNSRSFEEAASWAVVEGGAELVGNLIPDESHWRIGNSCECK